MYDAGNLKQVLCDNLEEWDGKNWEIGIDLHKLLILCIKQKTNENILPGTGNSTQCTVGT